MLLAKKAYLRFMDLSDCCEEPLIWRLGTIEDVAETGNKSFFEKEIGVCSVCKHICRKRVFPS